MKIHEYQAKELLRKYGVATPRGYPCFDLEEAVKAAKRLGRTAIKPQVHLGSGGVCRIVHFAASRDEARSVAAKILGAPANAAGKRVKRLLVEEAVSGTSVFRLTATRASGGIMLIASLPGRNGDVANAADRVIHHETAVDPETGLTEAQVQAFLARLALPDALRAQACTLLKGVCAMAIERGAENLEIDPVLLTDDGALLACGVHACFTEESLVTHPEIGAMRDPDENLALDCADT